ncbi:MAG: hypothetical protein ACREKH_18765 [Candidatus Rokuibacteriota bacterium]
MDVLRARRVRVWYSPTNIVGAQQWHDAATGRRSPGRSMTFNISPFATPSRMAVGPSSASGA